MQALGRHLIVEYYDCNLKVLDEIELIEEAMLKATEEMNATRVAHTFHKFAPQGVSGAVIIEESHLTIHTWPEYGYAAVDFYSCGTKVDPHIGVKVLQKYLQTDKVNVTELLRGFVNAPHNQTLNDAETRRNLVKNID